VTVSHSFETAGALEPDEAGGDSLIASPSDTENITALPGRCQPLRRRQSPSRCHRLQNEHHGILMAR
jgi:hypothetical protein